ncbi:ABC transporter permease [Flavimarina sp. Hel_I_48]|uniref:ABC transporter permease n=1 Tax=Flavimarina sp. Hel_I_48 TaxID=1392488 RepID=UPI00068B204E|nr:FtsX-like permease family protein [Flavimarina sp. Hel_I_48]
MAWRDGRASIKKLILFMASIILGIAAVVSIQSFGDTLKKNIALQSKSLMGADYKIDSDSPVNEKVVKLMDSLGGARAKEISFASMAAFSSSEGTKLMQIRGITGGFPFYGTMDTEPVSAAADFQQTNSALVDATVMLQLGLKPGDSIKVGNITLPIAGSLKSLPGSNAIFSSVAPPVVIPYSFIEESGLVQTGSRINYEYYFVAPANQDMEQLEQALDPILDKNEADLDTHVSTSERLGRRYENFGRFLNLVAFVALLLGCVGIASAIHIYIKEKLRSVAVLKCIGASRRQTFMIYLVQIAGMGLLGGILGTIAGLLLQQLFPILLRDFLPVDVQVALAPQIIIGGVVLGVIMSVLFALYPLMSTLYVSPLQALRVQTKTNTNSKRAAFLVGVAIVVFILLFSFWLLENWKYALSFVGGVLVTFALLTGIAALFIKLIKSNFPTSWNFEPRQSLLNLFRPQNQTLTLILAIGVGSFLISTLYFTKDLLLAQANLESNENSPNIIMLDIQREQVDSVAATVKGQALPVLSSIPIVSMRVQEINGKSVNQIKQDTSSRVNGWILSHEFRVTYRDSLIASESLNEGTLTKSLKNGKRPVPISVSSNFADDANVKLGDKVTFNVQGVLLATEIGSIRMVDWSRLQLNFSIVFPKGVLEDAPQFGVLTTKAPDASASAKLQRQLVRLFPNVSILDLRQLLTVVEDILNKITLIINFMAFFSILTGIIVLLGAVRTSKYQRIKESVLLRTLGARSKQILKILALEYFYLGALGAISGILLSLISSQLLTWIVFDTPFLPSIWPFLVLFPLIVILVMAIGLGSSIGVIKSPPLQVLRKQ